MVVFAYVRALDEDTLLGTISANGIRSVIDIRPSPVFEKPHFQHRSLVLQLYHRDIHYVGMAMLAFWPASDRRLGTLMPAETHAAIEPALELGLTLCLYDQDARAVGWLEESRRVIRLARTFVAELHPRALVVRSR